MDVDIWKQYARISMPSGSSLFSLCVNLEPRFDAVVERLDHKAPKATKPHKAHDTTTLLDEIAPDRIQNHSAKSPDFNCVEDIWSHMDREIRKQRNISDIEVKEKIEEDLEQHSAGDNSSLSQQHATEIGSVC